MFPSPGFVAQRFKPPRDDYYSTPVVTYSYPDASDGIINKKARIKLPRSIVVVVSGERCSELATQIGDAGGVDLGESVPGGGIKVGIYHTAVAGRRSRGENVWRTTRESFSPRIIKANEETNAEHEFSSTLAMEMRGEE